MVNNKNLIRDKNLTLLKQLLFTKGSALKAEMSKETGISVVTINSLVSQLVEEEVLIEGELTQQSLGRPAITYHFNYNQNHFLLLSIQEKRVNEKRFLILLGKIVNLAGEVQLEEEINFEQVTLPLFLEKIHYFLSQSIPIDKISLSIPGKLYDGQVLSSWHSLFDQWNIAEALLDITPVPIVIQNDAHLLTVGYTISHKIALSDTIVGIFYPESSMPGITIYSNGTILEGGHNLAGEAKFLPHLIDSDTPNNEMELVGNLVKILEIYNAVIAPNSFVISAESVRKSTVLEAVENSQILSKQMNQPTILFIDHFQDALTLGLRWLIHQDSTYQL